MAYFNLALKRLFDIFSSLIGLIVLVPLLLFISIIVKTDSKGPVFYKQKRLTKDGRVFTMYKFRTMYVGSEYEDVGLFNYKDDPRVTKVGKFLRSSSLDELPQLINIIKGEMSVIGPRPSVLGELGDYETLNQVFKKRFLMKAGLTGLAQIKGRNNIHWSEKVILDNQYIDLFKKYGILIDLKLLFLSLSKVFKKEDIFEVKSDDSLTDAEAAKLAEEEIIRIAQSSDSSVAGI